MLSSPCNSPVAVFDGILESFKHFEHSFKIKTKQVPVAASQLSE